MEKASTGAPLTQQQQQRPYEVHGNQKVPGIQDPIRGLEGQEVVLNNFSTSDSSVAAVSPMGTNGNDTTRTSSNIFNLAVNRCGFDYRMFDGENGDRVDVDVNNNDDDNNI